MDVRTLVRTAGIAGLICAVLLAPTGVAYALTVTNVGNGGTGIGFPGGFVANTLLTGNGLNPLATTTIGSGLTLAGGVLSTTFAGFAFPWSPVSYGNATSTTLGFLNGFLATASSTVNADLHWGTTGFWNNTTQRFGLGSTSPGSLLSIGGNTTGINFADNATSTFSKGVDIRSGCFSINGTCVGAGSSGTVTSVALSGGTTGLTSSGGPITTSGTITLAGTLAIANGGTFATSYTLSNGLIAYDGTRLVNYTGYTLTSAKLTVAYASSTAQTVSSELTIPNASTPTLTATGDVAINTTTASSSARYKDGSATRSLFPDGQGGLPYASSTLAYLGSFGTTGSTTIKMMRTYRPLTLLGLYCDTDVGTAWVEIGNGSATTTAQCSTTPSWVAGSNTWTMGQVVYIVLGHSASSPNMITISPDIRKDAD